MPNIKSTNFYKTIFFIYSLFFFLSSSITFASEPLVTSNWLNKNLNQSNIKILDIRNRIDGGSIDEFIKSHIPNSIYSNYIEDGWRVQSKEGIPGVLPDIQDLQNLIQSLGIGNDDHVIIVSGGTSSSDFGSAARVYWTFKTLSHDNVSILNGGYQDWIQSGFENEIGLSSNKPSNFIAKFTSQYLAVTNDVDSAIKNNEIELIDARPSIQYSGKEKSGAVSRFGTIPSSKNIQQNLITLVDSSKLKSKEEVRQLLLSQGVNNKLNAITFCNTGHWAAVSWFALSEYLGYSNVKMYDGSLAEWDHLEKDII